MGKPWVGLWRAHEKCGGSSLSCGWSAGEAPWGAGGMAVGEVCRDGRATVPLMVLGKTLALSSDSTSDEKNSHSWCFFGG